MVVRRTSSVAAAARAAARDRRAAVQEARRKREAQISELADTHAIALAMIEEVKARAAREVAEHQAAADAAVLRLLELGERVDPVAELLALTPGEVRAARKRARGTATDQPGAEVFEDGDPAEEESGEPAVVATPRSKKDSAAA